MRAQTMNMLSFQFAGVALAALPSGALWMAARRTLIVSDLHLGKAARGARRSGALLPPHDAEETLSRLARDLEALPERAEHILSLGDSFDTPEAANDLPAPAAELLLRLTQSHRWTWVEGNHDPASHLPGLQAQAEVRLGSLTLRHIAKPGPLDAPEVSGHYHPKHRLSTRAGRVTRPCFVFDQTRMILPAYGSYTGGLWTSDPAIAALFDPKGQVLLTGAVPVIVPLTSGQTPPAHGFVRRAPASPSARPRRGIGG